MSLFSGQSVGAAILLAKLSYTQQGTLFPIKDNLYINPKSEI
jgi:hypothetical protein